VTAGSHTLDLGGVAVNCAVTTATSVTAIVAAGDMARVGSDVACRLALRNQIVFTADRSVSLGTEVFVMDTDGSNQTRLTNDPATDSNPAWSPDGTKIGFQRQRIRELSEIWVINADGSGQVDLSNNPGSDSWPDWSP